MSTTKTAYVTRDGREGEQEVNYIYGPAYEDVIVTKGYYFKTGFKPQPTGFTVPGGGSVTIQLGEGVNGTAAGGFVTDAGVTTFTSATPDEMLPSQAPRDLTMTITHLVFYGEADTAIAATGGTNQFTVPTGHGLNNGQLVTLTTTNALPSGLTANTLYYIVSRTATTVSLALTPGGSAITHSGAGTGTHKIVPYIKTGFFSMLNNPEYSNGKTRLIG